KLADSKIRLAIMKFERSVGAPKNCNPQMAEELVAVSESGACTQIRWREQDCSHEQNSLWLNDILGVLVIGGRDQWLVFKSTNSKSNGITAYPFDGKKINEGRAQFAHPPGC